LPYKPCTHNICMLNTMSGISNCVCTRLANRAKLAGPVAVQYMIIYQLVEQLAINVVFFTDAVSISQLQVHHKHTTAGHACCLATMSVELICK